MASQDTCHMNKALEDNLACQRQTSGCSMRKGRSSKGRERDKALRVQGLVSAQCPKHWG